jgi:Bacteriophage lambda head decoration protein D
MSQQASFSSDTYTPDKLIASNPNLLLSNGITVLSGQNLARGSLLGRITASGKYVLSLTAAADGSQTPAAILADDCDASAADKAAIAYFRGDFQEAGITFGTTHTAASTQAALRDLGIFVITSQGGV